jgi:hypothetical protein
LLQVLGEWEWVWDVKFNEKGELAFAFETKKGQGVCYNGKILGGDWKDVYIRENCIEYTTVETISYEDLKKDLTNEKI